MENDFDPFRSVNTYVKQRRFHNFSQFFNLLLAATHIAVSNVGFLFHLHHRNSRIDLGGKRYMNLVFVAINAAHKEVLYITQLFTVRTELTQPSSLLRYRWEPRNRPDPQRISRTASRWWCIWRHRCRRWWFWCSVPPARAARSAASACPLPNPRERAARGPCPTLWYQWARWLAWWWSGCHLPRSLWFWCTDLVPNITSNVRREDNKLKTGTYVCFQQRDVTFIQS